MTADLLDLIAGHLTAIHGGHERANRHEVTGSDLYGCVAAQIFDLRAEPPSDPHVTLPALVGTGIHRELEPVWPLLDPGAVVEQQVTYRGVTCTVDAGLPAFRLLLDVKSVANAGAVADRIAAPKPENLAQLHVGAMGLREAGHDIEQVGLLLVPRDGHWSDVRLAGPWPVDKQAADEACDWAANVRAAAGDLTVDPRGHRGRPPGWCRLFCEWATTCRGAEADDGDLSEYALTVAEYVDAKDAEKAAAQRKRDAAAQLHGLNGRVGGWKVRTTGDTTSVVLDEAAVKGMADEWEFVTGRPLPVREQTRRGYVTVSRAK